jgi:hypothetical protein
MRTVYARFRVSEGNDQGAVEWLRDNLQRIAYRIVAFDGLVEPEEAARYVAPEKQGDTQMRGTGYVRHEHCGPDETRDEVYWRGQLAVPRGLPREEARQQLRDRLAEVGDLIWERLEVKG